MALTESQKELSKQYFQAYPEEELIIITLDGNVFLNSGRHDAQNHQKSTAPGEPLLTVTRKAFEDGFPEFDEESLSEEEKEVFDEELKKIVAEEEDLTPALSGGDGADAATEEETLAEEEPAAEEEVPTGKGKKGKK